jgi:hypothetical protein
MAVPQNQLRHPRMRAQEIAMSTAKKATKRWIVIGGGENASNRSDNQAAEVDTKDDLQDLALALKFMKNEKTSNQELNTLMLDLSNEVQRHKSYAKHFLGSDSVNSDSSGQIGMVVFMLLHYLR